MGALKKGLNPRAHELGIYVCGGRGRQSRKTPDELRTIAGTHQPRRRRAGPQQPADRPDRQQRRGRRLPDLPARVRAHRRRRVGRRAAGHERGQSSGQALSLALTHGTGLRRPSPTPRSSASLRARFGISSIGVRGRRSRRCWRSRGRTARTLAEVRRLQMPARHQVRAARRQREASRRRAGARTRTRAA